MTGGVNINPDEVHGGANSLESFADEASGHLDRLGQTGDRVTSHASGDSSGVGSVIVKGVSKATKIMADTGKQIVRVVKGSGKRLHSGTDAHVENNQKQKEILDKIHPQDKKIEPKPEHESSSSTSTSAHTPHDPPKPKGENATPPLHDKNKPPSATNNHSEQFEKQPNLPKAEKYDDPLPTSTAKDHGGLPPDKARGAKVEQLSEDRVTRDPKTGLITHVDGKSVKEYINDLSKKKAGEAANPSQMWKDANPGAKKLPKGFPGKENVCSAVAIDRKTGLVTHGVNGKPTDLIPDKNLHPLLQQNLQNLRGWQHEVQKADGTSEFTDGRAHPSIPANHAEVKAVNELLWHRESTLQPGETLGPDTMKQIGFDPRWTRDTSYGAFQGEAPACANCNTILHGAESYTGRYQHAPLDVRYGSTKLDK